MIFERLTAFFYDRAVAETERASVRPWRQALLADLSGAVIEIGSGTGANLDFYPRDLDRLVLTEPYAPMRTQLETKLIELDLTAEVRPDPGQALDFPDATFDAAVVTLVLCTVPEPEATLAELHRVLKPGGRLLYIEHVLHEDPARARTQRWMEPPWKVIAGGCHLTRDTGAYIEAAGFEVVEQVRDKMKAPRFVNRVIRGEARRR